METILMPGGKHARWARRAVASGLLAAACSLTGAAIAAVAPVSVGEARQIVADAAQHGARWRGPQSGPAAQPSKVIALVAEDLRNGGIVGVAQGVREAARALGWTVKIALLLEDRRLVVPGSVGPVAGGRRPIAVAD